MAVCVAVIGKENSPLYINCTNPDQVRCAQTSVADVGCFFFYPGYEYFAKKERLKIITTGAFFLAFYGVRSKS
jgi:hypothetical protein